MLTVSHGSGGEAANDAASDETAPMGSSPAVAVPIGLMKRTGNLAAGVRIERRRGWRRDFSRMGAVRARMVADGAERLVGRAERLSDDADVVARVFVAVVVGAARAGLAFG